MTYFIDFISFYAQIIHLQNFTSHFPFTYFAKEQAGNK